MRQPREFSGELLPVLDPFADLLLLDGNMRGQTQKIAFQGGAESVVNRQRDHQRHDARGDADHRDHRDHGDHHLFAFGAEVAAGDEELEHHISQTSSSAQLLRDSDFSFRPQQRKQNHIADRFRIRQDHGQPVDADAFAARRRHAIGHGAQIVLVHLMRFFVAGGFQLQLHLEAAALLLRIVQLGVGVADLHAGRINLETLDEGRIVALVLGERRNFHRIVVDDGGLEQRRFHLPLERLDQGVSP